MILFFIGRAYASECWTSTYTERIFAYKIKKKIHNRKTNTFIVIFKIY